MPADFLANDFAAIARAMRRETTPAPKVMLRFWFRASLLTSEHDSVEAAVAEAYKLWTDGTVSPDRITTADGTVLLGFAALAEAMARYQEGVPI
jgi:hypothetical protein